GSLQLGLQVRQGPRQGQDGVTRIRKIPTRIELSSLGIVGKQMPRGDHFPDVSLEPLFGKLGWCRVANDAFLPDESADIVDRRRSGSCRTCGMCQVGTAIRFAI